MFSAEDILEEFIGSCNYSFYKKQAGVYKELSQNEFFRKKEESIRRYKRNYYNKKRSLEKLKNSDWYKNELERTRKRRKAWGLKNKEYVKKCDAERKSSQKYKDYQKEYRSRPEVKARRLAWMLNYLSDPEKRLAFNKRQNELRKKKRDELKASNS